MFVATRLIQFDADQGPGGGGRYRAVNPSVPSWVSSFRFR
jgi:hypothetical protein